MLVMISLVCLFFLNNIVIKYMRKKIMFYLKRERFEGKYIVYMYYFMNFISYDEFV